MKQTVTYTEEVEREELIDVCDECRREVDEDGNAYVDKEAAQNAIGNAVKSALSNGPVASAPEIEISLAELETKHYCSECDSQADPELAHVERANEWLESESQGGDAVRSHVELVRAFMLIAALFAAGSVLPAALSGAMGAATLGVISLGFITLSLIGIACVLQ